MTYSFLESDREQELSIEIFRLLVREICQSTHAAQLSELSNAISSHIIHQHPLPSSHSFTRSFFHVMKQFSSTPWFISLYSQTLSDGDTFLLLIALLSHFQKVVPFSKVSPSLEAGTKHSKLFLFCIFLFRTLSERHPEHSTAHSSFFSFLSEFSHQEFSLEKLEPVIANSFFQLSPDTASLLNDFLAENSTTPSFSLSIHPDPYFFSDYSHILSDSLIEFMENKGDVFALKTLLFLLSRDISSLQKQTGLQVPLHIKFSQTFSQQLLFSYCKAGNRCSSLSYILKPLIENIITPFHNETETAPHIGFNILNTQDGDYLPFGELDPSHLILLMRNLLSEIYASFCSFPLCLRYIYHHIHKEALREVGFIQSLRFISDAVFHKFIGPAIAFPETYYLTTLTITPATRNVLYIVAKTISRCGLGYPFPDDSPLAVFNDFIQEEKPNMDRFLVNIFSMKLIKESNHNHTELELLTDISFNVLEAAIVAFSQFFENIQLLKNSLSLDNEKFSTFETHLTNVLLFLKETTPEKKPRKLSRRKPTAPQPVSPALSSSPSCPNLKTKNKGKKMLSWARDKKLNKKAESSTQLELIIRLASLEIAEKQKLLSSVSLLEHEKLKLFDRVNHLTDLLMNEQLIKENHIFELFLSASSQDDINHSIRFFAQKYLPSTAKDGSLLNILHHTFDRFAYLEQFTRVLKKEIESLSGKNCELLQEIDKRDALPKTEIVLEEKAVSHEKLKRDQIQDSILNVSIQDTKNQKNYSEIQDSMPKEHPKDSKPTPQKLKNILKTQSLSHMESKKTKEPQKLFDWKKAKSLSKLQDSKKTEQTKIQVKNPLEKKIVRIVKNKSLRYLPTSTKRSLNREPSMISTPTKTKSTKPPLNRVSSMISTPTKTKSTKPPLNRVSSMISTPTKTKTKSTKPPLKRVSSLIQTHNAKISANALQKPLIKPDNNSKRKSIKVGTKKKVVRK